LPRTTRKTRKTIPKSEWKGRRITGPNDRPLSEFFRAEFDKLKMTRTAFGKLHDIDRRQVGCALRGDLHTTLRTLAHISLIFGFHLELSFEKPSLLEKLAWAAEGIDPCKVEGF